MCRGNGKPTSSADAGAAVTASGVRPERCGVPAEPGPCRQFLLSHLADTSKALLLCAAGHCCARRCLGMVGLLCMAATVSHVRLQPANRAFNERPFSCCPYRCTYSTSIRAPDAYVVVPVSPSLVEDIEDDDRPRVIVFAVSPRDATLHLGAALSRT